MADVSVKYLIIGQGLAGTTLSMQMMQREIPHVVVDNPGLSASSKIATGLANPIVLKRFRWVTDAEKFFSAMSPFYQKWEEKLDTGFYRNIDMKHIFTSTEEVNTWMEKSASSPFNAHLGIISNQTSPSLKAPYGQGLLQNISWLNTKEFLWAYRFYLDTQKKIYETVFDSDQLGSKTLRTKKGDIINYDQLILCTGHLMQQKDWLRKNPFTPVRGELMIVKASGLNPEEALHAGVFVVPMGHGLHKVGSTYHYENLEDEPTQHGLEKLKTEFEKVYSGSYEVVHHLAGVRPATQDRKPLLGKVDESIYCFNGLGSRGVLMAPYLSELFLNYLEQDHEIPPRWDVARFT